MSCIRSQEDLFMMSAPRLPSKGSIDDVIIFAYRTESMTLRHSMTWCHIRTRRKTSGEVINLDGAGMASNKLAKFYSSGS